MPIITLLTDFGTEDEYVGVMKGVILSINPQAIIVDITHHIAPHRVVQAAQTLWASHRYFPNGSIHVVVVDPGVGTHRRVIALQKDGHFFIAPDNGALTRLLESGGIESIVSVANDTFFLKPVSTTFHGRDIFAPVAAHLSKGLALDRLGPEIKVDQLERLTVEKPHVSQSGELIGRVAAVDHFGNLITDIDSRTLFEFAKACKKARWLVLLSGRSIAGLSQGYDAEEEGRLLALIDSRGYLEIAVSRGSAKKTLGAEIGDRVRVSCA